jgi:hypothetical protein
MRAVLVFVVMLSLCGALGASEIYRVVDKDGNVVYTDQPPGDGSEPVNLPPLSVVETEKPASALPDSGIDETEEAPGELKLHELRKMYRDFRITQPMHEETFWGTANAVFISWGSGTAPLPDMSVRLTVDGQTRDAPADGGLELTLGRGEHQGYAELVDAKNRVIVASETVTFFVKQHSAQIRVPRSTQGGGF